MGDIDCGDCDCGDCDCDCDCNCLANCHCGNCLARCKFCVVDTCSDCDCYKCDCDYDCCKSGVGKSCWDSLCSWSCWYILTEDCCINSDSRSTLRRKIERRSKFDDFFASMQSPVMDNPNTITQSPVIDSQPSSIGIEPVSTQASVHVNGEAPSLVSNQQCPDSTHPFLGTMPPSVDSQSQPPCEEAVTLQPAPLSVPEATT